MRYLFFVLLALNVITFGYYNYFHQPSVTADAQQQADLVNPVKATNVSSELPPMIGTKK